MIRPVVAILALSSLIYVACITVKINGEDYTLQDLLVAKTKIPEEYMKWLPREMSAALLNNGSDFGFRLHAKKTALAMKLLREKVLESFPEDEHITDELTDRISDFAANTKSKDALIFYSVVLNRFQQVWATLKAGQLPKYSYVMESMMEIDKKYIELPQSCKDEIKAYLPEFSRYLERAPKRIHKLMMEAKYNNQ